MNRTGQRVYPTSLRPSLKTSSLGDATGRHYPRGFDKRYDASIEDPWAAMGVPTKGCKVCQKEMSFFSFSKKDAADPFGACKTCNRKAGAAARQPSRPKKEKPKTSACQGLCKEKCQANTSCYQTKGGGKLKPHCRKKPVKPKPT